MNKIFFVTNRQKLGDVLSQNSIAIFFAGQAPYKSADETYPFTPNRNFYYLTGIDEEKVIMVMININGKVSEMLFIQENDPVMAKWVGETISEDRAKEVSGIEDIKFLKDFESIIASYFDRFSIDNVYLDLERQEFNIPQTSSQNFAVDIMKRYPYVRVKNVYHDIALLRTIKREEEIELIKKAIDITYDGIKEIWSNAKPGMKEYEIEAYFNYILKKNGVKDFAFPTIAATGKNATILHYVDNNTKTEDGELMLLDLGAQYKYYNGDISRTFPINGKFSERQKEVYNIVLEANETVMKAVKPGITTGELQDITKRVLAQGCKRIGLIKEDSELNKYYYHGVAHPLGLDTHDVGPRNIELKPGMIITDEPGLYIEEEGIGVRIEDDILVTEDGYVNLSAHIIKSIEDIEMFMSKNND
ncbi:peptidase M24 [Clostridium sulfidigenes]|uniref:Xaa-Pro aminopeptidase n=1 Tax=Clostridium sulfidigenes TaxID=318464 RepID=A0A084J845_9CLOT|nr:aminopeptidase P family protein [Clostridium sulfidigenes]KEZ85129.1 peptidase M24 [Clostridium sulfidigenes]